MNANVSGVMNELVPGVLTAYPTASIRTTDTPPAASAPSTSRRYARPRGWATSMSICCGVNVVHTSRRVPSACVTGVNGSPGRGPVDPQQLLLGHAVRVGAAEGQEHPGVGRRRRRAPASPGRAASRR